MKTRFIVSSEDLATFKDYKDVFENHYKKVGFSFNEGDEEIFKEFDKVIPLNIGDYIFYNGIGMCIITWKCYEVNDDVMVYAFKIE